MMDRTGLMLTCIIAALGGSSMLYFLCLAAGIPFGVFLLLLLVSVFCFAWIMCSPAPQKVHARTPKTWIILLIAAAGSFLITNRSFYLATPDGGWDAWGIWNAHARFLLSSSDWTNLFKSTLYDHPDYPLCLPAGIAWISRMIGPERLDLVAYGTGFWITLAIPLLLFLILSNKNILVASLVLLSFATNDFYLANGISMYADTLLGAFILAAIIAMQHSGNDKRMLAMAAFFAGCAAWTKNEGLVFAALFFLFYARRFLARDNYKRFIAGIALPLLTLIIFKGCYAPGGDLVPKIADIAPRLAEWHRYEILWLYFTQFGRDYFLQAGFLVILYIAACIVRRQSISKNLGLLFACLGAYMLVYILSPYDPEWHVRTSLDRLMLQLMPALVFVPAAAFSKMQLPYFRK